MLSHSQIGNETEAGFLPCLEPVVPKQICTVQISSVDKVKRSAQHNFSTMPTQIDTIKDANNCTFWYTGHSVFDRVGQLISKGGYMKNLNCVGEQKQREPEINLA